MTVRRNLTIKVWRQEGPDDAGRFESHAVDEVSEESSFLELLDVLNERLIAEGPQADAELQRHLHRVQEHALRITERVEGFRQLLQDILSVNLTLVGLSQNEEVKALTEASIRQNDEVKKISAWAAILFAPTLIGTVYGMNFDLMPELRWAFGYPFAMVLMVSATLYVVFKRRGWL